mgnify:CR=1 FL=1
MSMRGPVPTRSQRLRLGLFRVFGAVLLLLSLLGLVSAGAGVYFVLNEPEEAGWFALVLMGAGALGAGLLVAVAVRALRVDSMEELKKQGESKWLDLGGSKSPYNSLERPREKE